MSGRCTIIVPDAGPLNSLWVAGRLDLLLTLAIPVVVIDAVYDEATSDHARFEKDRDVKVFIDSRLGPEMILETTSVGQNGRAARARGEIVSKREHGDLAIAEFMNDRVERYVADGGTALLLFEDADFRNIHFVRQPAHLHLLSTVAMLRGLEEIGLLESADDVLAAMLHPTGPMRQRYARRFKDLPSGNDISAPGGSRWKP